MKAEAAFQQAVALRNAGELARADAICSRLTAESPGFFPAYHLRGAIAIARGDTARGIELIQRSLVLNPAQAPAHTAIGFAWLALDRPDLALEQFERALHLAVGLTPARFGLGNALRSLGRLQEALAAYETVVRADPTHADAINNLGLVLGDLGRLADALAAFQRAVALKPEYALARRNMAAMLQRLGRPAEALACYDAVLRANPQDFDARLHRGSALQRLKRLPEALADCEAAHALAPGNPLALTSLGNVQLGLGRHAEALQSFERALALRPADVDAGYGRGAALLALGQAEAAAEAFTDVLRSRPDHLYALGSLFSWRMSRCDWCDYAPMVRTLHAALGRDPSFTTPLLTLLLDDPDISLRCAQTFVAERYPADPSLGPPRLLSHRSSNSRLRVAYVSADFCDHPVSTLLIGTLERHDRKRFEVFGVSLRPPGASALERRVRAACDRFVDAAAWTDRQTAEFLRDAGIDIAIDLMGLTDQARLGIFAHRAAPLQIGFLGYAGTTGAPYIDYLLADSTVVPPADDRGFSEAVVRLPHCLLPNDGGRVIGSRPSRREAGLPERGLVLCAFTQTVKINPPMFDIWMRVLGARPEAVLWLRDPAPVVRAHLRREAASRDIDPERLIFAERLRDPAAHLGRQSLADLYLDTLPYNAHSTTCDALWAGVPVLTCMGKTFASRLAASALRAVGLPELVTGNLADYESLALELTGDPPRLAALRSRLAEQRLQAPLFDTTRYTRQLEDAFIQLYDRAAAGLGPAGFASESPGAG